MPEFNLWVTLLTIGAVMGAIQGTCAYLILMERKVSAYLQDRLGPNRVGPGGLLQPIADGLKFLLKEDIIPNHVDKLLYLLAPAIAVTTATLAFAVVPFGPTTAPPWAPVPPLAPPPPLRPARGASPQEFQRYEEQRRVYDAEVQRGQEDYDRAVQRYQKEREAYDKTYQFVIAPNINIGILLTFAVTSLAVYGVILGGWSSESKYSFLGAMRASAQFISYEIPLGLSFLGVAVLSGSLNLERVIQHQVTPPGGGWGVWFICYQPLAFLLFLTGVFAECNRLPFDLPEAEQELVGGYHTEYSALKFAMFFLGEYTHMITTSFLLVTLFFGGWHVPLIQGWVDGLGWAGAAIKVVWFAFKMFCFIFLYMWVRWTIPRFRFDQLMGLAWKVLIPLALLNLLCVVVVKEFGLSPWLLPLLSLALLAGAALVVARMPPPQPKQRVLLTRDGERLETAVR